MNNDIKDDSKPPVDLGLCKDCKWRFRRVFIPTVPEEIIDEDDEILEDFDGSTNSIIMDICLLSDMDIGLDITTDCNHYEPMGKSNDLDKKSGLFKNII